MSKNRSWEESLHLKNWKLKEIKSCKFVGFLEDQQTIQVLGRPVSKGPNERKAAAKEKKSNSQKL